VGQKRSERDHVTEFLARRVAGTQHESATLIADDIMNDCHITLSTPAASLVCISPSRPRFSGRCSPAGTDTVRTRRQSQSRSMLHPKATHGASAVSAVDLSSWSVGLCYRGVQTEAQSRHKQWGCIPTSGEATADATTAATTTKTVENFMLGRVRCC
jgi:hypothetical protein